MNLSNGASRIGSPAERPPGRRLPLILSVGAAGLALALVLGAGPLAAAAPGVERAGARVSSVSSPPDPAGIHPIDYSPSQLGRFSGGLAAVKSQGKWGYVDKTGKVVIPFLYSEATPFEGNWASVRQNGRWGIVDRTGQAVTIPHPLSRLSRFSEGLAAAKATSGGRWGYVDRTGGFVIKPQFDHADDFSQGLAAVALQGSWLYVTPTGTIALVTPHYRSYSFTADGLALAQEKRDGRYGYIRGDGRWAIPPTYPEARPFSQGLAPVRIGSRWGYVTTTGAIAISPLWAEAYPFSGGLALVLSGIGTAFFVDSTGAAAHGSTFAMAEGYSEQVAIVGDGKRFWYVDEHGVRLPVGQAVLPGVGDSPTCSSGVSAGVSTNYVNGLTFFQLANNTKLQWSVTGKDTWAEAYPDSGTALTVFPGLPKSLDSALGKKNGQDGFLYQYNSLAGNKSGTYPFFDVTLTSGDYTITLSSSDNYSAPPPAPGHPWWEYLSMAVDAMDGLFGAVTGEWAEVALGIYDMANAAYDIASGTADGESSDNENAQTQNILVTSMNVTKGTATLSPLDGGFCGGDSYTVSDASDYVFSLTTIKSQLMPPTVQLNITPYATYFAQNAYGKLDMFRKGKEPGGVRYISPPQSCVYSVAMENWADDTNFKPCSHKLGDGTTYDYFTKASSFPPDVALAWWSFANNLDLVTSDNVQSWLRTFGGTCSALPADCPNALPMTANPTSFDVKTLETTCVCAVEVSNAALSVSAFHLPDQWWTNAGSCSDPKPPSPCTYEIQAPAGANGTFNISDALTSIPISVKCTSATMVVAPLSYSGTASAGGACPLTVNVQTPRGPVTSTPSTFVTSSTCTAQKESCSIMLSLPNPTPQQSISLSDMQTTQPITVECLQAPFTISQPTTGISFNPGWNYPYCVGPVWAQNTHGTVTAADSRYQSSILSSTCVGPQVSCSLTVKVPAENEVDFQLYDGTQSATTFVRYMCFDCATNDPESIVVVGGLNYNTSAALGYKNTVYLNCFQLPLTATQLPAGGSVDISGCTISYCPVVTYAPAGGTFVFQDARGIQAPIVVNVVN